MIKTENIKIEKNKNISLNNNEFHLEKHIFEPYSKSPPNEFMLRMYMRLSSYKEEEEDLDKNKLSNNVNKK